MARRHRASPALTVFISAPLLALVWGIYRADRTIWEECFYTPVAEVGFEHALPDLSPSTNLMYALRIEEMFSRVRARAVPRQSNRLPLADSAQLQTVFEFHDRDGIIAGFCMPDFLSGLHMTGLHLHVITADRKHGGHQLGAVSDGLTATLQHAPSIELGRPLMPDFLTMSRRHNMEADLDRVER